MKERKIMYHMIISIEKDLIDYLYPNLSIDDFTNEMMKKIESRSRKNYSLKEMLQQLGIGDFIELINKRKQKLDITQNELEFLNKNCSANIVQIRNRVMHTKEILFNDFPILQNLFTKIDKHIHSIAWVNVLSAREEINNNLEMILEKNIVEYTNELIDNLPELNCEEIEFVGRGKEIGELKKYLLNDKIRVISVVASGGYGKTALVLKVLNDFKKEHTSQFELILWISFKTKQLDKTSFVDIENAIVNIAAMNKYINDFIGGNKNNPQQELFNLAKQFNTLVVLDNLETINHQEMIPFIEEFINYGKILITSRVSLGELDKRYDLNPMIKSDAIELTNRMLNYYNIDEKYTYKEIEQLANEILFSNPLSIKWAVRSMYEGALISEIKSKRENIVSFCMSNVYDKIDPLGKNILALLSFCGSSITKGQIVYYLQKSTDDLVAIDNAILQINRACFIDKIKMKNEIYELTEQGKIFMDNLSDIDGLKELFSNKKREINTIHQNIFVSSEQFPYNNDSINIFENKEDIIISASYLYKAVKLLNDKKTIEAIELIKLAENISPGYSECYKIHGLALSYLGKSESEQKYLEGITKSKSKIEKIIQLIAITNYYIRVNRYLDANKYIEEASVIDDENVYVKLEKAKVLLYTGKYTEVEKIFNSINSNTLTSQKEYNIFVTRKADLQRRKAEQLDQISQKDQRKNLLLDAFRLLSREKNPDNYMNSMICKIAGDIVFLPSFRECAEEMFEVIFSRLQSLNLLTAYNDFKGKLQRNMSGLDNNLIIKIYKLIYEFDIENLADNVGIITYCGKNYGFIANLKYPGGIYFISENKYKKGNKVTFEVENKNDNYLAINVKLVD